MDSLSVTAQMDDNNGDGAVDCADVTCSIDPIVPARVDRIVAME